MDGGVIPDGMAPPLRVQFSMIQDGDLRRYFKTTFCDFTVGPVALGSETAFLSRSTI